MVFEYDFGTVAQKFFFGCLLVSSSLATSELARLPARQKNFSAPTTIQYSTSTRTRERCTEETFEYLWKGRIKPTPATAT